MKKIAFFLLVFSLTVVTAVGKTKRSPLQLWPDGTEISAWFADTSRVDVSGLKHYDVTDYGVDRYADGVQTKELQAVIDRCASEGGGVIVIPRGTFLSGSLFFKPGTHLLIEEGGELKGSDRIRDFKIVKTRMEGQTLDYFAALVNADGVDGFTLRGLVPSTATDRNTGRNSGFAVSIIPSAPIWRRCARVMSISRIRRM